MPRPKVPASQRQRAAEACNFCRASKKRCSATVPCTACKKRGIEASCYLTHKPWGTRRTRENVRTRRGNGGNGGNENPATAPPVAADVESSCRSLRQRKESNHPERHNRHASLPPETTTLWSPGSSKNEGADEYRPLSPSDSRVDSPADALSSSRRLSSGHDPHARMLLNLRGNRGKHRTPRREVPTDHHSLHRRGRVDIFPPVPTGHGRGADGPVAVYAQRQESEHARVGADRVRVGDSGGRSRG